MGRWKTGNLYPIRTWDFKIFESYDYCHAAMTKTFSLRMNQAKLWLKWQKNETEGLAILLHVKINKG